MASFPSVGSPGSRAEPNPDGSEDTVTFGSNGFPAPNAMVFDGAGNLYVSDSFQGAIYRIASAPTCATPCPVEVVAHDPLLATAGTPPFGANGLALGPDGQALYVANTGDHRVLAVDLAAEPPAIAPFSISLPGADGLRFDDGLLWVAANQADQVVGLDARGRPVARGLVRGAPPRRGAAGPALPREPRGGGRLGLRHEPRPPAHAHGRGRAGGGRHALDRVALPAAAVSGGGRVDQRQRAAPR